MGYGRPGSVQGAAWQHRTRPAASQPGGQHMLDSMTCIDHSDAMRLVRLEEARDDVVPTARPR